MKVNHVNYSDHFGGAARAAYRIHSALLNRGVDSSMLVSDAGLGDERIRTISQGAGLSKIIHRIRPYLGALPVKLLNTKNSSLHSAALVPSSALNYLNSANVDVVNLHWINKEVLSIFDVSKLKKPVVWTLHDMWPFCGAEHVTEGFRWKSGYTKNNRPEYESGVDINRFVWLLKSRLWREPFSIITPSVWMASCVKQSALMCDWPVTVIPNPIDTNRWRPIDQAIARNLLGLPADGPLVLFGAMGGGRDPNKGFELLKEALSYLRIDNIKLELIVVGERKNSINEGLPYRTHCLGQLCDDISLCLAYCAADVVVIPSRVENFPNTALEAQSCGTPVVGFSVGGMPDIITNGVNGYLALPFDTEELAFGIKKIVEEPDIQKYRTVSRRLAVERYGSDLIAEKYIDCYKKAMII